MTLNIPLQTGAGRVWLQADGPNTAFSFLTASGAGAVNRPGGTVTPIFEPDPARHNAFRIVDSVAGIPGLPTSSIESVYRSVASLLLAMKCPGQVQYRYGTCDRPDNPSAWDKILHLYNARPGTWNLNPNISRDPANLASMVETLELTGEELFEVVKLAIARITVTETTNALSIAVRRNENCGGICGAAEEACDTILIGTSPASYGVTANLLASTDAGGSFTATAADPLAAGASIIAVLILGDRWIAVDGNSTTPTVAYSDDSGATWTSTSSGAGPVGALNGGFALDFNHGYAVGNGGYILFTNDGFGTLSTQDAGSATANNLNAIKVLPSLIGYAVGDSDTIIKTSDGENWAATGDNTGSGDNIISLDVISENVVWVGTDGGGLWYSQDGGDTWAERTFSGSGSGAVRGIAFANAEFGFIVHDNGTPVGSLFRTVDGGLTWEKSLTVGNGSIGSTPTNAGLNAVAACGVNSAFIVGNAQGGSAFVGKAD